MAWTPFSSPACAGRNRTDRSVVTVNKIMFAASIQHRQAVKLAAEAVELDALGSRSDALVCMREAVLRHAEADRIIHETAEHAPCAWRQARAQDCLRFGDWLAETGAHSEAVGLYQEASDAYGSLPGDDAATRAQQCAQRALASIEALRKRPQERLYLLTSHYDRLRQQLALREGTEAEQAECYAHIAAVF